jgi:hypothetical protein
MNLAQYCTDLTLLSLCCRTVASTAAALFQELIYKLRWLIELSVASCLPTL